MNQPILAKTINENTWVIAEEYIDNLMHDTTTFCVLVQWTLNISNESNEEVVSKTDEDESVYDVFFIQVTNNVKIRRYEQMTGKLSDIETWFDYSFL